MASSDSLFVSHKADSSQARTRLIVRDDMISQPQVSPKQLQKSLKYDAATWSIFAALLMLVGFGALIVGSGNFSNLKNDSDNLSFGRQYIYVICMALCGGSAFIAAVIGILKYIYYAGFPSNMINQAIANDKQLGPCQFVYLSFAFVFIACIAAKSISISLFIGLLAVIILVFIQTNRVKSLKNRN